ncbi:MAG TPA: hypothetical protein ENI23_02840 [bacterium]|nr:hypothetical protein [bacterium]
MNWREKEQLDREYEIVRLQFSSDFRELMREHNVTYKDLGVRLNMSVLKVRQMIHSTNLTIREMSTLAYALQGTIRILIILPRP